MSDFISNIPFLNNAKSGKNSIWRYLITMFLSLFVASLVAGVLLGALIVIWAIFNQTALHQNFDMGIIYQLLQNPIFLIFLVGLSFSLSFFFLGLSLKVLHKKKFISVINTGNKVRWSRIGKGAIYWFVILAALDLISYIIDPGSFKISFNLQNNFWILALLALIAFPIQASFEEVFFRGYLMQGISLVFKKPWVVLLVTSLIFSLLHWWNGSTIVLSLSIVSGTFIIGLMLGIIALADNGIEMAIGVHIINNIYVSVIHSSPDGGLGNLPSLVVSPSDPYAAPLFLILAAVVLIYLLFRNRKEDVLRIFKG
ncbi:MAG: CPBP family intramembrane metalloprotease [Methanobacteriales archaeon HGW-Methanobacteriales-1]|jgi:hypothetical protein|nr:MAG: CPBP family intramembrane metalloprotease [Methanobacteriales archaeon HGW-Methanobacteriales-1]